MLTWRLTPYDDIPSTSDECVARARAGEPEGLAILARRQSAGRGSHGRVWASAEGNLALSALLRPPMPSTAAGQWSLLAGLAAIEALSPCLDDPSRLTLKWPNDILLDGAKLAGILAESESTPDARIAWLVIGIGANLAHAPDIPDRPTASLAAFGPPAPEEIARRILVGLAAWRTVLLDHGFAPIRTAWLARAHRIGTQLRATSPAGAIDGAFAGLTPSGALLLATPSGIHTITAGEIAPLPS